MASGILLASLVLAGPGCTDDDAALCDRLAEKPSELTVIHWSNGITGSAATWSATLTDGVLYGSDDARQAMAEAVAADEASCRALLAEVDDEHRWAFEHLHEAALDPTRAAQAEDPGRTIEAVRVVWDAGVERCRWML